MEEAGMISQLRSKTEGVRDLGKIDKIYLENTNLVQQLGNDNQNVGNVREIFFLTQTRCKYPIFRTGLDSTFKFYDPSPFIRQPKLEFQGYFHAI